MRLSTVRFIAVTLAILSATGAAAAEGRFTPFMAVKGPTAQPIGHYEFCATNRSECTVRSATSKRVRLTAERWNALVEVNASVNTEIKPATDQEIFGQPEVWVYPTTVGDCEDYVLLKRRLLIQAGWPVGALLVTVVRQVNGDGHAVLTVLTDRGDLVLDNLNPQIIVWNQTPYRYIKRQSEYDSGKWVSIEDGRDTLVGSLKK
ncbi:MAG TPA: transglutaminase-like cysteine peptidase [Bauldia sp.]|nr:transglutaminase-like cysteine peptidase [Bauldia sp.]